MYWSTWDTEVLIRVGTDGDEKREFRASRNQLAQQSGYIKSLLESSQSNEIHLPNVSADVFAPLLRYVSTGYLELNNDNVYTVLLASHILHMPRAVEICRDYLMRREDENRRLPLLVRPIPSRKYLPFWPPPPIFTGPQFYPPLLPPPPIPVFTASPHPGPQPSTSLASPEEPTKTTNRPDDEEEEPTIGEDIPPKNPSPTTQKQKSVVKDIACCDGPVRFKRVLNTNYGCLNINESDNRQQANNKQLYICTFCKHTFKSHYCYRKHTRRHINPVSGKNPETKDLNVQYYPCKTCGSKFPSYYFVHKHRKMCHQNENDDLEEKVSPKTPDDGGEETNAS